MKVVVTGGSGYVGQFLVKKLLDSGDTVVATSRSIERAQSLLQHPNLTWHAYDLGNNDEKFDFLEGADSLVHTALDHKPGLYREGHGNDPAGFMVRNSLRSILLLKCASLHKIKRTVFISSRAVFGEEDPEGLVVPIPDEQPPFPDTLYGIAKASIEGMVDTSQNIGLCILRPTGVYGLIDPIDRSKWYGLVNGSSLEISVAGEDKPRTEVHGDDVAKAVLLLLRTTNEGVEKPFYNCSDVVLSLTQIKYVANQVLKGASDASILDSMPEVGEPHHEMATNALLELGWKKSGMPKVVETVRSLLSRA